jgi:glycerol-3-phosphate dehydrogenase
VLLHNAPHLVQPLRFVLPFYGGARVPEWKWRAGLTLYDLLAGASNIRRSRPLSREHLSSEFPGLKDHDIRGGAEYFDAQMDDARLCIEVIKTAAREGACVANYVEAIAFERRGEEITGIRALDRLGSKEFPIRARQVLNAAGPSVDAVCRLAGDTSGPHLQPTKGVHIVAPGRGLTSAFLLLHPSDGRVFFVIPWMSPTNRNGRVKPTTAAKTLIGTTDTDWAAGRDLPDVQAADIDYLLAGFNFYFRPPLAACDILGSFAGLRPLLRAKGTSPSSRSREFQLILSPGGLLSAAGGKYTTYRHMAEEITEVIGRRLRRPHRSRTRDYPLDGTPDITWDAFVTTESARLAKQYSLQDWAASHLVHRYGRRASFVASYLRDRPHLASLIIPGEPDLQVELPYQRDHEMACYAADHLLRRTRLGLFHPHLLQAAMPAIG